MFKPTEEQSSAVTQNIILVLATSQILTIQEVCFRSKEQKVAMSSM